MSRLVQLGLLSGALTLLAGCLTPRQALTHQERVIAAFARPILTMDPDAVWTDCYRALLRQGPSGIEFLMRQPAMTQRAAPEDLRVLLHTSLVRLLANPATAPRLSAACLETTLGLVHFDLKVGGDRLGTVVMPEPFPPRAWHDLYPADFDHALAGRINLEADRQTLQAWWQEHRTQPATLMAALPPEPYHDRLWRLLARHYADRWQYQPEPGALLVSQPPQGTTLLDIRTYEYNLVRAACIWLGSRGTEGVQERLIDLVGSQSAVLSYNARFALGYSRDERIRELIGKYRSDRP